MLSITACSNPTESDAVCLDESGNPLNVAPLSARVDLATPKFSNPKNVTNPLFPIARLDRALLLGAVDGKPLRVETTLLAEPRTIELDGEEIETLVSQYVAWIGGRIAEVAIDLYAQADDGAVWYFGEDVFNYENGVVNDIEGTWHAGEEGPAAMIMPASPKVGDVFRPENICGVVFEEVTVKSIGMTVTGPRGPVTGAIVVEELHMDGGRESKTFAPGYGEFHTADGTDLEAIALAVPTDALPGPVSASVRTLTSGAITIFDAALVGDWSLATATISAMNSAWNSFRAGGVPPMLEASMRTALAALTTAVNARQVAAARQAAVDAHRVGLDFELRHRPRADIDLALLDNWARQLLVDVAAGNRANALGSAASLRWIRERLGHDLTDAEARRIDSELGKLRMAAQVSDLPRAAAAAAGLRAAISVARS
ncbi:MAG: hypothetical protein ACREOG_15580 [Gemmatimonadaceae bacterium]